MVLALLNKTHNERNCTSYLETAWSQEAKPDKHLEDTKQQNSRNKQQKPTPEGNTKKNNDKRPLCGFPFHSPFSSLFFSGCHQIAMTAQVRLGADGDQVLLLRLAAHHRHRPPATPRGHRPEVSIVKHGCVCWRVPILGWLKQKTIGTSPNLGGHRFFETNRHVGFSRVTFCIREMCICS